MADHILGDSDIVVDLAVVDLENQADKVGQDGGTACLGLDRGGTLAGLWADDGQSVCLVVRVGSREAVRESMCPESLRQRAGKSWFGRCLRDNVWAWESNQSLCI